MCAVAGTAGNSGVGIQSSDDGTVFAVFFGLSGGPFAGRYVTGLVDCVDIGVECGAFRREKPAVIGGSHESGV